MFESARLTLTLWYVILMMVMSVCFSLVVYRLQSNQIRDFELQQRLRQEYQIKEKLGAPAQCTTVTYFSPDFDLMTSAHQQLVLMLVSLNGLIFALATGFSYFLAGKTLDPIKRMVNQQRQFITDVSHDLKTPLAAMKTELEVNLRDPKLSLTGAKSILESNVEEVDQLYQLCQRLLQLTVYNRPRSIVKSLVAVDDIIQTAYKKVKALAQNKNLKLTVAESTEQILADKLAIVEVLVILLDNAIKYSPPQSQIRLAIVSHHRNLEIQIVDQGPGIPAKELPHIFDRFYRVDKARTKQTAAGYGLGLAIAKSIIEAHRGQIIVKSQEGQGSTFAVRLPK